MMLDLQALFAPKINVIGFIGIACISANALKLPIKRALIIANSYFWW